MTIRFGTACFAMPLDFIDICIALNVRYTVLEIQQLGTEQHLEKKKYSQPLVRGPPVQQLQLPQAGC